MEWVESYKYCIQFEKTDSLNSLLPTMFDLIDETIKLTACNAETVTVIVDGISMHCSINMYHSKLLHLYKHKTWLTVFQQCRVWLQSKTFGRNINHIWKCKYCKSMHFSINMFNSKLWYQYKQKNLLTFFMKKIFNNKECGLKVKIVVGMW